MIHFSDTKEAVLFGKDASEKEKEQLKAQRQKLLLEFDILLKESNFNEAMKIAVQAQFCREALCAKRLLSFSLFGNQNDEEKR